MVQLGDWSWEDDWTVFKDWLRNESNSWDPAPVAYGPGDLTVPNAQHLDPGAEASARAAEQQSQAALAQWQAERDKPLIPHEWLWAGGLLIAGYVAIKLFK